MTERLKFQGRLREKGLEVEQLKLKIEALRTAMRDNLDPFDDVMDLRLDLVASQAVEAAELQIQLEAILEEIKAIKKALGN